MRYAWIVWFLNDDGSLDRPVGVFSSFKRAAAWANEIDTLRADEGKGPITNIFSAAINHPEEGFQDTDAMIFEMDGFLDHAAD